MQRTVPIVVGAAAALPAVTVGVLLLDWKLAKRGPQLAEAPPFEHDTRVGGDGPALRMVWLGDSSVAGAGASSADASLPRLVARALDRPIDVLSVAVSGSRVHDVVTDQLHQVATMQPDVVVVSIGTNDIIYRTSRAEFREDHRTLLDGLPEGALVVLLGACDMGACRRVPQPLRWLAGWWGRQLDAVAREEADARGVAFLDMATVTGPVMRRHPEHYAIDLFHSSDEGYRYWADTVATALRRLLARHEAGEVARGDR